MAASGRVPVKTAASIPTGAIGSSGTGTGQDMRGQHEILAILNVLAFSGTPTMTVKLQLAPTLNGTYVDIPGGAFAAVGAALSRQTLRITADNGNGFVRASYTIGGSTPSYTFCVDLVSVSMGDTVLAEAV